MPRHPLLIAALFVMPVTAFADVRYEMQMKDLERGESVVNELLTKDGKLRMSVKAGDSGNEMEMIYLPEAQEIIMINHDGKDVRRMTKADMERMGGMMSDVNRQMQEALKNMPPEARAQAEKVMQQMGQGGMPGGMGQPPVERTVRPTRGSSTVAGIRCDVYEVIENGVRTQEVCVADPDDLESGDELMESLAGLADFMKGFTEALGSAAPAMDFEPVEGKFPIIVREYEDGKPTIETSLVAVEKVSLSDDMFKAPAGYRERKMMQ